MRQMHTNQVEVPRQHLNLAELSAALMDRKRIPVGFFVSGLLWQALAARWRDEGNGDLGPAPATLQGAKIAIDPSMPDAEFDVAFTEEAWTTRLRELNAAG
jgi:hypothetical protein